MAEWQEVEEATEIGRQASLFRIKAFGISLQSEADKNSQSLY